MKVDKLEKAFTRKLHAKFALERKHKKEAENLVKVLDQLIMNYGENDRIDISIGRLRFLIEVYRRL